LFAGGSVQTSDIPTTLSHKERGVIRAALGAPLSTKNARDIANARWQTIVNQRSEIARPSATAARAHANRVRTAARELLEATIALATDDAGLDVGIRHNIALHVAGADLNVPAFRNILRTFATASEIAAEGVESAVVRGRRSTYYVHRQLIEVLAEVFEVQRKRPATANKNSPETAAKNASEKKGAFLQFVQTAIGGLSGVLCNTTHSNFERMIFEVLKLRRKKLTGKN